MARGQNPARRRGAPQPIAEREHEAASTGTLDPKLTAHKAADQSHAREPPMIVLGLTGSIGMGKSTTARMFRDAGAPVFEADAAVHALYRGAAVEPVGAMFPKVVREGLIDRGLLSAHVLDDPTALLRLEAIVHPLVAGERRRFVEAERRNGAAIVVLDIPLLYEIGAETALDRVAVVSASKTVQKARVMARPGMTAAKFSAILARQVPDAEKRRRADFIIDTGRGLDVARAAVERILAALRHHSYDEITDPDA